jgi:hypothetical protein
LRHTQRALAQHDGGQIQRSFAGAQNIQNRRVLASEIAGEVRAGGGEFFARTRNTAFDRGDLAKRERSGSEPLRRADQRQPRCICLLRGVGSHSSVLARRAT